MDLLEVGKNLHDHMMVFRYWALRHPERGLAMGSPLFNDPDYEKGGPGGWLVTATVPDSGLRAAIAKDEGDSFTDDHPLLKGRSHLEMSVIYAAFGCKAIDLEIPVAIMTYCMGCVPTSRASITLGSRDPVAPPAIDPNYYATEVDRFIRRED